MKSFYYTLLFLSIPMWLCAQSSTQNYIATAVPYQTVSDASTLSDVNSNTSIQYVDGLGRPSQTVQRAITPLGADLVNGIQYDNFGRDNQHWLPAVAGGNNGAYYQGFASQSQVSNNDAKPYSITEYEPSPLNRVTAQFGPGVEWYNNNKKKNITYTVNNTYVRNYYIEESQLFCGLYSASSLYKNQTTDEDGKTVEEFTDKLGRKVLSRVAGDHDTYYVYDDRNNLRYVLPPLAADQSLGPVGEGAGTTLDLYGYIYHYDGQNRCTEKKLPGCDWIYMVYDKVDRLILSQDGNQRAKPTKQWTVTKYDAFGRMLYTGLISSNDSRATMESNYSGSMTPESYTGSGPVAGYTSANLTPSTVLTVNYYDNYGFLSYSGNNPGGMLSSGTLSGYDSPAATTYVKTLLTGTRVYHLDNPSLFEVSALYYDKYGRVVQSRASNHLGGYEITYNKLDFKGKVSKSQKEHNISGQGVIPEVYRYAYDKAERLTLTRYKLGANDTIALAANSYDELGRLKAKVLGSVDATTYSYNVRSWTTDIIGSRFSENLYYNANPLSSNVCFNGNIAGMQWDVPNEGIGYKRAYNFVYDNLNRLTNANYYGIYNGSVVSGTSDRYNETFTFDKMGNFNTLTRNENGNPLNNLSFTYTGNQLKKVDNSVKLFIPYGSESFRDSLNMNTEYTYDKNGSITSDINTGISTIQYNLLNLPDQIQFIPGHKNLYTYDASGKKLEIINYSVRDIINVPIGTISSLPDPSRYTKLTTDYVGNMIYENGSLKEILLPEGYYQGGVYYYYLKDHLGNNRVVINSSGAVMEKTHYYPSGMRFYPESTSNSGALPYRYNGKELEAMNGLNQYDYGARRRGAGLPVWTAVDPLCEKHPEISPYAFCSNNPVNRVDPDGLDDYSVNENGKIVLVKKTEDKTDRLIALGKNDKIAYDDKGNMTNSAFTVNKGILDNQKESGETTYMSVKGNEQAKGLFEFLGENTGVEWGRVAYGKNSNYITTNNSEHDNGAQTIAFEKLLKNGDGNLIKKIDHSHQDGSSPSGFPGEKGFLPKGEGDRAFAQWLYKNYSSDAKNILLRVYNPLDKSYTKYNNKKILSK